MRELNSNDLCEYADCQNEANYMVFSRKLNSVYFYCDYHRDDVLEEGSPEYTDTCMNCGCEQGIN